MWIPIYVAYGVSESINALAFNPLNFVMKGDKPKITNWRAFVQGKQIGTGYQSRTEALEAAQRYFDKEENDGSSLPNLDARASCLPIKKAASSL